MISIIARSVCIARIQKCIVNSGNPALSILLLKKDLIQRSNSNEKRYT